MRKLMCIFLIITMVLSEGVLVNAEVNNGNLGLVLEEVSPESIGFQSERELLSPYTLYIMGTATHIEDQKDGKIYMGVEVYCTDTMKKITTRFYLQQLIDDQWIDVAQHTSSADDTDYMIAFVSVAHPPSGVYRVETISMVEDYNGYVESETGNSPSMKFVSPYL